MPAQSARSRVLHSTALALIIAAGSTPAMAQQAAEAPAATGVQDIVVTAQKRGENLQRVPIAISALSADAMQAKGISTVTDIVQATPTLYAAPYTTTSTTLFLFMRGMGLGDPIQITKDSSIGIYENGVYNPRPQTIVFDLADPERVEILRGPQGTLYGRNTTGGAVNIVSRPPSGEFGVRQLASYASRNQYRSVTNVDLPEFGGFKLKGTLAIGGDDGFSHNVDDPAVAKTHDFGLERHVAGRIAARFQPSTDFTADYSFQVGRITATPMLLQAPALEGQEIVPGLPYHAKRDQAYRPAFLPFSHVNIRDHALSLEWKASDALTLRSITGLRHFHSYSYQDTEEAYGVPLVSINDIRSNMLTQEVQAIGSFWEDRIKYAAGLYYYRERATHGQEFVQVLAFGPSDALYGFAARSTSKAAYAQLTFTPPILDDRLDLTAGGRVTEDKRRARRDLTYNGFPVEVGTENNQKFTRFNPAFTLAYRWSDQVNSYAKVSTGYRAGGSSETTPDFTQTYGPESLTSYEIGLKAEFLDRRVRTNIAAFYNRYKDIQLDLVLDATNPTISTTLNAGRANLKGIEAEIAAAVTRDFTLNISYAYLDTKVQSVRATAGGPNIAGLFRIPYAPKHSLNISGDLIAMRIDDASIRLHADYNYKSRVWNTSGAGPDVIGNLFYSTKGYSEVNGRITLQSHAFGKPANLSIFAKNVLDSRHVTFTSAPGAQLTGYLFPNVAYAAPRTFGAEVSFAF